LVDFYGELLEEPAMFNTRTLSRILFAALLGLAATASASPSPAPIPSPPTFPPITISF
jgi:hypothetical protein